MNNNSVQLERDLEYLMNVPHSLDKDTQSDDLNAIYRFITMIVVKLTGKRALKKWLSDNKGKSPLDMVTMSDVAYSLTLIANNREKWDQAIEISKMEPEEQKKWKNVKKLSAEERESYKLKQPLFTAKKGNKCNYKQTGWNEEGEAFYYKQLEDWKTLAKDETSWSMLQEGWDVYNAETRWIEQWVIQDEVRRNRGEVEVTEVPPDAFALPGDDGFENDRAGSIPLLPPMPSDSMSDTGGSKRSYEEDDEDDDGSDSSLSGHSTGASDEDEEGEEPTPVTKKKDKRRRKF